MVHTDGITTCSLEVSEGWCDTSYDLSKFWGSLVDAVCMLGNKCLSGDKA